MARFYPILPTIWIYSMISLETSRITCAFHYNNSWNLLGLKVRLLTVIMLLLEQILTNSLQVCNNSKVMKGCICCKLLSCTCYNFVTTSLTMIIYLVLSILHEMASSSLCLCFSISSELAIYCTLHLLLLLKNVIEIYPFIVWIAVLHHFVVKPLLWAQSSSTSTTRLFWPNYSWILAWTRGSQILKEWAFALQGFPVGPVSIQVSVRKYIELLFLFPYASDDLPPPCSCWVNLGIADNFLQLKCKSCKL